MAVIVPKPGLRKETAQLLLELADKPRDVRTNTDSGQLAFEVPEALYERYVKHGEPGSPPRKRAKPKSTTVRGAQQSTTPYPQPLAQPFSQPTDTPEE